MKYKLHKDWLKEIRIYENTFRRTLQIFWWDRKLFDYMMWNITDDIDDWKFNWITYRLEGLVVVYIEDMELTTLLHEMMHAMFHRAREVWIEYTDKSEEWYTYVYEYIITEVMKSPLWSELKK